MKHLVLAFSRLKRYYQKDKLIFVLYLLGSITCVLMFLFAYGNMLSTKYAEASSSPLYRRYQLPVGRSSSENGPVLSGGSVDTSLFEQLEGEPVQYIRLDAVLPGEKAQPPSAFVTSGGAVEVMEGRGEFTGEEIDRGKAVVILSQNDKYAKVGETVSLAGKNYEVIGVSDDLYSYIPLSCYLSQGLMTGQIVIQLTQRLSISENNQFLEKLDSIFHPAYIENPNNIYRAAQDELPMSLALVSGIYLLVFLSFTFLIKYMADRNRYESVVYSVVGARRRSIFTIMFLEIFILSSFSTLLGILIHKIFYSSFFVYLNMFENLTYSATDYLFVFVASVVLSCCTLLPFILRYSRESLAQSRSRLG